MTDQYQLRDRYTADQATVFLTGIQALARLPLEQLRADARAGHNTAAFVSGYQGSPLGGYGEEAGRAANAVPEFNMVVRPALNEEAAATAVMGSQVAVNQPDCRHDGIIGVWYGKAPGVDRAADALRHAVFTGTSMFGGAVALVGDDPGSKSSTLPSSSAGVLADLHMPLLYPGDPGEALDLGRHAIAMSRATGLWSALKIVADVADGTASIALDPDRVQPVMPMIDGVRYHHSPDGRLLPPHNLEVEKEILTVRYDLALQYAAENKLNHAVVNPSDAWLGIVASGITYREVREAFARLGLANDSDIADAGIRLLKMGMPLPFNPETVRNFAKGLERLMVIEEKAPNVESLIKDALYDQAVRPQVVGKRDQHNEPLFPVYGALDADLLIPLLHRQLDDRLGERLAPPVESRERELIPLRVERSPFFCSGCPHNRSTEVPDGSLVGAGIGCHTMTLYMEEDRVGEYTGVTCMGSEGGQWWGMSDFLERDHYIQNIGDGTYFHSGQLAVQGAIAAGVNMTYKLLYNGTVAMTGGQDPKGQLAPPDVATVLLTQGVTQVLITADDPDRYRGVDLPKSVDVWHRDRLIEAQEHLAVVPGVTVLIHDQACAAEARRDRKRGLVATPTQRVVINHRICEGCGDCGQVSNCLSVQPMDTVFGRKTKIDQTTCNLDYSCLDGDCPSFMTIELEPDPDAPEAENRSAAAALLGRVGRALPELPGRSRLPSVTDRLVRRRASRQATEADALDALDDSDALNTFTLTGAPAADLAPPPDSALPDPVLVVPADDFAMRVTGIGGTGVVTVAQVLGTAAMLDGFHVRGLDQIGLSQKAGPVVSDVRLSRAEPAATNRLGNAQADLLLAFDQLTAASPKGLLTADPERTTVVGSTSPVPTGQMITHPDLSMPTPDELSDYIAEHTRADAHWWADAQEVTRDLFGQSTTANMFVVGMAVQAGTLPIAPAQIERAISLNAVSVEANQVAFRWGRALVSDPELVQRTAALARRDRATDSGAIDRPDQSTIDPLPFKVRGRITALVHSLSAESDIDDSWAMFAFELIEWGKEADAHRWLDVVERVAAAERQVLPDSFRLSAAVAANLYKLVAYKDEYEVARLMTDVDGTAAARAVAGNGGTVSWKLHPPMLRALGLDSKISIGAWAEPGVRALAKGKRLRGTPADPFGRAEVRRVERELPGEYISAIDQVLHSLSASNLDAAVGIAELPDLVRGYEDIKLANVAKYREQLGEALRTFA